MIRRTQLGSRGAMTIKYPRHNCGAAMGMGGIGK